ncbi:hypothetical protein WICANDRAFT_63357 [Wickerhamomyces anomalus NRRL Y-366-8]|uniref:RNI-like protein n=1 Tax=Wickerhamomyces anomalus (strain ATCC 58044 / CBS 1984 / NCYC 433 / NRRL Y-366-8) TaxID=683960 RepID=A0A1E3P059_WICAA|nr:uncharacterized protein WICANDRAFT_63357 [Wickerhamomyces anomalus NRRL Y-366-8]ODQ58851.1 hypothetical protein WICANDRAFT_63357 [Wickerhamomyces anomalus NRRL Y-366-8]
MPDSSQNEIESGVSNVEIDWFLRGKLPSAASCKNPSKSTKLSSKSKAEPDQDSKHTHSPAEDEHNLHSHIKANNGLELKDLLKDEAANEKLHVLSRSKSYSEVDSTSHEKKKTGFLKSLFSRSKNTKQQQSERNSHSNSPEPLNTGNCTGSKNLADGDAKNAISRTRSLSQSNTDLDPKLEEFLRYYKSKGLDRLHQDLEKPSRRASVSSAASTSQRHHHHSKRLVDALGRPIPPHPDVPPLPPAIIYETHFENKSHHQQARPPSTQGLTSSTNSSTAKISGFLRRHNTGLNDSDNVSRNSSFSSQDKRKIEQVMEKSAQESHPVVIPGLEDLPKLKRVAFDVPVFFNDPPQQIPSRTPRKGEVEILKDGSIVIHKLTSAERRQIMNNSGGGIVVGGSGHLKIISNQDKKEESDKAREKTTEDLEEEDNEHEAQKHSIGAAAAAAAAEARAKAAPNELRRIVTNNEDEVMVSSDASKINIDKPMVRHNKSATSLMTMATVHDGQEAEEDENDDIFPPQHVKVPLDILYTRCCHLREILPIPATLKQLKPGSTDPISLLQLRNPKPSLVEVLTFADFVSVAPVLCVALDGVSLSSEMLRIILSALLPKKELEKLTLRNTPIDDLGWRLLCWFLTKNHTLSRLDLTQVPSLTTNVQKPSKTASNIVRMECNMNDRSDMNWNLLNAALISRKGIDELVINGAKMNDEQCMNLFEMGLSISTTRLGLAYNDLTEKQCEIIANHMDVNKIVGVDLGYNDLNGKLGPFNKRVATDDVSESNLKFISLNSTNLDNSNGELDLLISTFAKFKDLRYIDLSNNKKLFPNLIISLSENLPLYPNLARIHLDYNDLKSSEIVAFAELIPFCKSLSYVSLVGNHLDTVSASALTNALKISKSLITLDLNYDEVAPKFRESIGLYTVRNMQHQVYGKQSDPKELQGIQEELSHLLLLDETNPDPKLIEKFFEKAIKIRDRIHETIDELFRLRLQGNLSTDGKETLIRFCFIDASIEKGLSLLDKKTAKHGFDIKKYLTPHPETPLLSRRPSNILHSSSYLSENNHSELLPFGMNTTSHEGDIHIDAEEIKDEQRARAKDTSKIKEEASILKLNQYIKNQMDHKDLKPNIDSIQDISGERFREILLQTNDLNNVVDVLDSIKKEGIPLEKIYERKDSSAGNSTSAPLLLETLKNTHSNVSDRKTIVSDNDDDSDSESDKDSYISDEENDNEINQAYDTILDHLERVRTNN